MGLLADTRLYYLLEKKVYRLVTDGRGVYAVDDNVTPI